MKETYHVVGELLDLQVGVLHRGQYFIEARAVPEGNGQTMEKNKVGSTELR